MLFTFIVASLLLGGCGSPTKKEGATTEKTTVQDSGTEKVVLDQGQEFANDEEKQQVADSGPTPDEPATTIDTKPQPEGNGTVDQGTTPEEATTVPEQLGREEQTGQETIPEQPNNTPGQCNNPLPNPPLDSPCEVKASNSKDLLIQADIITPQGIMKRGQVAISGGKITCVGCNCATKVPNATKIICKNAVLSPGLINPHDHINWTLQYPKKHGNERFEHRHDWRKGKSGHSKISAGASNSSKEAHAWGEIRMMLGGATSIIGSGGTSGLIRNLDRDREGIPGSLRYNTFPLGDSKGIKATSGCTSYPRIEKASSLQKYTAYVPHVAEGIDFAAHNEFVCVSSTQNGGQDLLIPNKSAFIHGIGLNARDISLMATKRTALIWSARTNVDLYGDTALAPLYDKLGVVIAIGTDWTPSGSMNMLRELQCVDFLNKNYFNHYFSDKKLVDMATINAARATHTDRYIGSIKVGLFADLALFDASQHKDYRAVIDARPQDVHLVLKAGKALYGTKALLGAALPKAYQASKCENLDVCGTAKLLCIKDENFSKNVSSLSDLKKYLTSKVGNAYKIYPLFFCGKVADEPSCLPYRKGQYPQSKANDKDGDGIEDSKDNCPNFFNPPRPMDKNKQADFDRDGKGDICDPCPLTPNTTKCKKPDPDDRDGDGIKDSKDNCPNVPNPKQEDDDKDGLGNDCDPCPNTPNPNGQKCPAVKTSIYDLKKKVVKLGTDVKLSNVFVTAVTPRSDRLFLQVLKKDSDYKGAEYSGIMVYLGGAKVKPMPKIKPGDRIDIEGNVNSYNGQIQLSKITALKVVSPAQGTVKLPDPVLVKPKDINSKSAPKAAALEGVLVKVENVIVISPNPDKRDYGEFTVADINDAKKEAVRVDDLIDTTSYTGSKACYWDPKAAKGDDSYCLGSDKCQCPQATCKKGTAEARCYPVGGKPTPNQRKAGDKFKYIIGHLYFAYGNYKIAPSLPSHIAKK